MFHRPLPYLFLARQVLTDARVPYEAFDALPLAAEPFAAVLDLFMTVVRSPTSVAAVHALCRSPFVDPKTFDRDPGAVIAQAADGCRLGATAAQQMRAIAAFLATHAPSPGDAGGDSNRRRRARAAVLGVLERLAAYLSTHDDRPRAPDRLTALVHYALEAQTFAPSPDGSAGVYLVDAVAARFGEFEAVYLVGLVETDWAERPRRNVFFAHSLLRALGWPDDTDRARAQQAAFRDVLTLARQRTRLSAFQFEGDTVVGLSTMISAARGLPVDVRPPPPWAPLFADETLTDGGRLLTGEASVDRWVLARRSRPSLGAPAYGGTVFARDPAVYRVSRVDRYVTCPFKYFASDILRLPEERRRAAGLDPLARGTLLHEVFEAFYRRWDEAGCGAITAENVGEADRMFLDVLDVALARLPEADRVLERLRLAGSIVAPGVADRIFDLEIAAGVGVARRLIEIELAGAFTFPIHHGLATRDIDVRGKADRIDVLDDDSLRVFDYKLGRMPDVNTSVQIGVYAHCASQWLTAQDGRPHPIRAATYLAFGDERRLEGKLHGSGTDVGPAVVGKASDFAAAVEAIEAGQFPPRPLKPVECQWCGYALVCRKEYRLEETDETAESL